MTILFGCSGKEDGESEQSLTVFAAASLTDAFEEIGIIFKAQNENVEIVFSFAGSSTLATQIIEGAQVDVFASANEIQMQNVQNEGLLKGNIKTFVNNRLVVITSVGGPIVALDDLATENIKLILASLGVPIREYTETMFMAMAEDPRYGQSYVDAVRANIISEETDVRQVAAKVALGEADAGIVYSSDVTPSIAADVRVIEIPDEFNVIASYPIAALSDKELAREFVEFVLSNEGQNILEKWGFIPVTN